MCVYKINEVFSVIQTLEVVQKHVHVYVLMYMYNIRKETNHI